MQLQTYFEDDFGSITMAAEIAAGRSQNEFLVVAIIIWKDKYGTAKSNGKRSAAN
jgi:hypothetical protein